MHSLIISNFHQEPMFTAEEVISEIEGMMEEVSFILITQQWHIKRYMLLHP